MKRVEMGIFFCKPKREIEMEEKEVVWMAGMGDALGDQPARRAKVDLNTIASAIVDSFLFFNPMYPNAYRLF